MISFFLVESFDRVFWVFKIGRGYLRFFKLSMLFVIGRIFFDYCLEFVYIFGNVCLKIGLVVGDDYVGCFGC